MDVAKVKRETEDARPREALWAQSARRFHARRERDLCWEWIRYHETMLRSHQTTAALLAAHHRQEIAKYAEMLGLDHDEGDAA